MSFPSGSELPLLRVARRDLTVRSTSFVSYEDRVDEVAPRAAQLLLHALVVVCLPCGTAIRSGGSGLPNLLITISALSGGT